MSKPKPCKHGRYFCMECHYGQEGDFKTLPEMYDALAADNQLMRDLLRQLWYVSSNGWKTKIDAALAGSKEQADE